MPRRKKIILSTEEDLMNSKEQRKRDFSSSGKKGKSGKVVLISERKYIIVDVNGFNWRIKFMEGVKVGDKIDL